MSAGKYITYLWTWPQDLIMWTFWILPFWALWGTDLRWEEGCLAFNLKEDSWPARTWYKRWSGSSIAHALMYNYWIPRIDAPSDNMLAPIDRIVVHEQHHVKQFESVAFTAFITALIPFAFLASSGNWTGACICGALVWILGHTLHGLGNFFVSWVLGGRAYRDSYHEQSAYAVDFKYVRTGKRNT